VLTELKKIPSDSIDLIFADPPYFMQTDGQLLRSEGTKFSGALDEWDKFENYKARNLSGGMKRRLEIARALLKEPKILILDEATSGLDPSTRQQILSDLKNLIKEKKITVLTITHLESEITDVNKIIKLEKGKIV